MEDRTRGALESLAAIGMLSNGCAILLICLQAWVFATVLSGLAAGVGAWLIFCEVYLDG